MASSDAPDDAPTVGRLRVPRTARYATLGARDAERWWVVLHGYAQLAADFVRPFGAVAGPERFVVAPEALSRFYRDGMDAHREVGASWMTREERDAEIRDYVGYLDALADRLHQASGGPPAGARLTLLGFSQGAATASRWALRGTATVDRLVLWAGDLAHDLDLERHAERLRGMDLTVVSGDDDPYVSADRRDALRERLAAHAVEASFVAFDGGHRLHRDTLRRLADAETGKG